MNQPGLDLGSPDAGVRGKALSEYKQSIDAAARLGMRWARPLPTKERPDSRLLIDALRELADHAARRDVQLLIENFGWMQSDPDSVVRLVKAIGTNAAASPDTGNWTNNEVRYDGLAKTFPHAATCDFKARDLGPGGEHPLYDLKRCFTIGWDAGFRGPWCLEHGHADEKTLFKNLRMLRDQLRQWIAERK
jgi:sugar phosphate isomerase/epimerase